MTKYIDANLLIRKIKHQIRLEELNFAALGGGGQTFCIHTLEWVLKQIDSLPDEQPSENLDNVYEQYDEQSSKAYNEAYLQSKIDKVGDRWKGIDVDKYMGNVRGREPSEDLEDEIATWIHTHINGIDSVEWKDRNKTVYITLSAIIGWSGCVARHFAKWGAEHQLIAGNKMIESSKDLDVTDFSKPLDPDVARAIADNLYDMCDEQPSNDLETEIDKQIDKCWDDYATTGGFNWKGFARHFYELGQASVPMPDEQPSKDVDEAAEEYIAPIENDAGLEFINFSGKDIKDAFIAGAQWQAAHTEDYPMPEDTVLFQKGVAEGKRLMLEDAVDGYVNYYEDGGGKLMAEAQVGCPYHIGDKVKIIIVKEE